MTGNRVAVLAVTGRADRDPKLQANMSGRMNHTMLTLRVNGFQPSLLPCEDLFESFVMEQVKKSDSVLLLGGDDIAPSFYGGGAYPNEGEHYLKADAIQIAAVQHCLAENKSLLGICRGAQVINVALGGNLIQHIEEQAATHLRPEVLDDGQMAKHDVKLFRNSIVQSLYSQRESVGVESHHHQAVDRLGDGLVVSASSVADGIVEAIEHETAPILGVQWHPEDLNANRSDFANLLKFLAY